MPTVEKHCKENKQKKIGNYPPFRKRHYSLPVQRAIDCSHLLPCAGLAGVRKVSMHRAALNDNVITTQQSEPNASAIQSLNQLVSISRSEVYSSASNFHVIARATEFPTAWGLRSLPAPICRSWGVHSLCGHMWRP